VRFLLAGCVWAVIITLVSLFFVTRGGDKVKIVTNEPPAHEISLKITPTFQVAEDPFALDSENIEPFTVRLGGKEIFSSDSVTSMETIELDDIELKAGKHEVIIFASPSGDGLKKAVRIEVYLEGNPLSEKTVWFDSGETISASLIFKIGEDENDHSH